MLRGKLLVAFAVAVLAGGCQEGGSDTVETTVDSNGGATVTEPTASSNLTMVDRRQPPALNIAPDGISLIDVNSGSARHITFGRPRDEAVDAARAALGAPEGEAEMAECGAGPMTMVEFEGGLTFNIMDGNFVGWSLDGVQQGSITTTSGIGLGSTRAQLENAYAVEMVEESTLGHEFTAGAMSGLLTSPEPDGKITDLWAGTSCVFR